MLNGWNWSDIGGVLLELVINLCWSVLVVAPMVWFWKAEWLYLDEFLCVLNAKHVVRKHFQLRRKWCVCHLHGTRVGGMMGICVFGLWRVIRGLRLCHFGNDTITV